MNTSQAHCLTCGFKTPRQFFNKTESYVEGFVDGMPDPTSDREGTFDQCSVCCSLDVDIFSQEGITIMDKIVEIDSRYS